MSDEQALGISDILFKPVLMRLIEIQQKSVEGSIQERDVRVVIAGNVSVARVAIGSKGDRGRVRPGTTGGEATNDAFMKAGKCFGRRSRGCWGTSPGSTTCSTCKCEARSSSRFEIRSAAPGRTKNERLQSPVIIHRIQ